MIKVKSIFKKENLTAAAGLGAGSLAAEIVVNKVGPMVQGLSESPIVAKVVPAIPIIAGLLLSTSTGLIKNVGYGMLAQGVSAVAKTVIPVELKATLGIGQDVMMGNVMMGEPEPMAPMGAMDYTTFDANSETRY
jgi:hypothetical protein